MGGFMKAVAHPGSRPASFGWLRLFAPMLLGLLSPALPAFAQEQYGQIIVFGDSYADNGNLFNGSLVVPGGEYPHHETGPNLGSLGILTYPTALQSLLGIPNAGMLNYAYAGATSGPGSPPFLLGYGEQIDWSLSHGQTYGAHDIVVINIGGNDGGASTGGLSIANAPAVAATAAANIRTGIDKLVAAGARNFMLSTFDDPSVIPNIADGSHGQDAIDADKLYGSLLFPAVENDMVPYAKSGIRIFTFNLSQMAREIAANPALYGFTNTTTPCESTPGCATPTSPGQYTNATYDGLHPTTGGFAVIANYMNNLLMAPSTFPASAELAQAVASDFDTTLFGRLDAGRSFASAERMALFPRSVDVASADGGAPSLGTHRLSLFVEATGALGKHDGNADTSDFRYTSGGGSIGLDYAVDPHLSLGLVFNYANPHLDLADDRGHIKADDYQFGAYASLDYPDWFADAAAHYDRGNYRLDRPGVVDTIRGETHADSYGAALRAGWLAAGETVRFGPLAGLAYTRSNIASYTETGDPLLTFAVGRQSLDALTGSAGVQLRVPVLLGGHAMSPYLNLTVEHEFLDGNRTLLATETQSPDLPIYTPIEGEGHETYGKLQAGVSAALDESLSLVFGAASTFARSGSYDVAGNVGLAWRF